MSRRAPATAFAVAAGAGVPAGWLIHTTGREEFGNLPLGLVIVMVTAWVAFGFAVQRWRAVPVAVGLGLIMLVVAQLLEGSGTGESGPTGALLLIVFLPIVAACVAAGVALAITWKRRGRRNHV